MDVFYFWESRPGEQMPGYLELCIETWRRNISDARITRIHHGNLAEWSGGAVDVDRLKQFIFMMQSDVAAAAVLAKQPGLFLDADTIILPGFDLGRYPDSKLTMYGNENYHVRHDLAFFLAPRTGHPLFEAWIDEANRRIEKQSQGFIALRWWLRKKLKGKSPKVPWWYLGNEIIDPLLQDRCIASETCVRDAVECGFRPNERSGPVWEEIPEAYLDFWFRTDNQPDAVIAGAKDYIIALQNSFSPQWYSALSTDEVLKDEQLISRTICAGLSV